MHNRKKEVPDIKNDKLLLLIIFIIIPELLKADENKELAKPLFYLNINPC